MAKSPAQRELAALRKMADLVEKMTGRLDLDYVAAHARKFPGSMGPDLRTSVARTRDLMMLLQAAKAARAETDASPAPQPKGGA